MRKDEMIPLIRKFNRDYIAKIGLLEKHIYDSEHTLAESRILLEIKGIDNCTSKDLGALLKMDAGFLSRTLSNMCRRGDIRKIKSQTDKRAYILEVTEQGQAVLNKLEIKSNEQINRLIEELSDSDKIKVIDCIHSLNRYILKDKSKIKNPRVTIRNKLKPGDAGTLIALHGELYKKECGYNQIFEGYVCKTFYEALVKEDRSHDKYWIAEADEKIIGSIAIIDQGQGACQLRWLLVLPEYRGRGLGKKLFNEAMDYASSGLFERIFLETTKSQSQAIEIYRKAGFVEKQSNETNDWGQKLITLVMEKVL